METGATLYYLELFELAFNGRSAPLSEVVLLCGVRGDADIEKAILIVKRLEQIFLANERDKIGGKTNGGRKT